MAVLKRVDLFPLPASMLGFDIPPTLGAAFYLTKILILFVIVINLQPVWAF